MRAACWCGSTAARRSASPSTRPDCSAAAVTVGVRPEHLLVGDAADGVAARTMAVESLGDAAYLYAESPVAPDGLIARIPPLDTYRSGESLHLHAQAGHCHLFDEQGHAFRRLAAHAKAA
jgi:multiple sugar transport system ATP-binding protein